MKATTLVLGLGNDLISDDGFGPAVAGAVSRMLDPSVRAHTAPDAGADSVSVSAASMPEADVESASVAGFHLLDLLRGYRRVLIVDVVMTGRHPPGTLLEWPVEAASSGRTLGGSHQADLATILALGHSFGEDLPTSITLLVAEAKDLLTIREELTDELKAAVPRAADLVLQWVRRSGVFSSGRRRDHDQARVLS